MSNAEGQAALDWETNKDPKLGMLEPCNRWETQRRKSGNGIVTTTQHWDNWRGITLLSLPSKVLIGIIIPRMKKAVEPRLRDEKGRFLTRVLLYRPKHWGVPAKIIKIIQQLYEELTCQVIHGRSLTDWDFDRDASIALLFLIVVEWARK